MSCELTLLNDPDQQPRKLALSGELCIFHALQLHQLLSTGLAPKTDCEIDLSQVSELDTAGVQLLLMAKREAEKANYRLDFIHHSAALLEVIELLNLGSDFGDPLLIPAERRSP